MLEAALREFLDQFAMAEPWLRSAGLTALPSAHRNFVALAELGIPLDLLDELRLQLERLLPALADADMAFNNLERMLANSRSPISTVTFLLRRPFSLPILLQLFSTSQFFSDVIIADPACFDFLLAEGHQPVDPRRLQDELLAEIEAVAGKRDQVMHLLRRRRRQELLRIGYRDVVLGEPLDRITESISDLADALVDTALETAIRAATDKHGRPHTTDGRPCEIVVLGMGKLGGRELNYSSDIDLIIVIDDEGQTDGAEWLDNRQFYAKIVQDMVRMLATPTALGFVYRVDLRLRPHGGHAAICSTLPETITYYENHGRTWERQALVKVRPIAGSQRLGRAFMQAIEPFIYQRYLNVVEIREIRALKQRIEQRTKETGGDQTDLKTGHGGIRDTEFVVQFLQLLYGSADQSLRDSNTLRLLRKLTAAGCINREEHPVLETAYRFLRKAEHRLQFMFDLATHRIPDRLDELDKLAVRLSFPKHGDIRPGELFLHELRRISEQNRQILRRLLVNLFREDVGDEPETDLVLDPAPTPEKVQQVLAKFGFVDVPTAHKHLMRLAEEDIPFLSTIRCGHFLAGIAPQLLKAIAETPDPDLALVNLEKVSASLGAKGVLWESCSVHPPLLRMVVNLCANSVFLSEILISNPGMIDELLDALATKTDPDPTHLSATLSHLLRGARQPEPILHSFKNTRLVEIGVRDLCGAVSIQQSTRLLSNLAEGIIGCIADRIFDALAPEKGEPQTPEGERCPVVIFAMGKLGGREISYHSDLDLVVIYDSAGHTTKGLTNQEFFSDWAARLAKTLGHLSAMGRLYQVDYRLRPNGRDGDLTMPINRFVDYYRSGKADLWEFMALTRARPIYGPAEFQQQAADAVAGLIMDRESSSADAETVLNLRKRMEQSRAATDLKRGFGGIVDVEFLVQWLMLQNAGRHPKILASNLWEALDRLHQERLLSDEEAHILTDGYTFLRKIESRLRIVQNLHQDNLPTDPKERQRLALRLGYVGPAAADQFANDVQHRSQQLRVLLQQHLGPIR